MYGTAQGIILVLARDTDGVGRKIKILVVLVPGLKRNIFTSAAKTRKGVKNVVATSAPHPDLGLFSVQLTRSDNMDHLDLTLAKESRR